MHIDFRAPGAWLTLNDHVAETLGVDSSKTLARIYQGTGHALTEICLGLAKLYPLKKKIYYIKNMNPIFDGALMLLAREGYKLLPLDLDILHNPDGWLAGLEREDLFVLYSADEPILGRAYHVKTFEEKLKDKNIFKIKVSHSQHFYYTDEFMRTCIQDKNKATIYSLASGQALAISGDRGRVTALTAEQLHYGRTPDLSWFTKSIDLDLNKITSFEQKRIAESTPVFKTEDLRVADRAVICWGDLDGAAVIDRLAQLLNIELLPPGYETRLETTSLSRWGGVRTMNFLATQGLAPEMIRGLVLIDHKLIDSEGQLENKIIEVRASILKDQLGS